MEEPGQALLEVDGSTVTLCEEIHRGNVDVPGLLDWGSWQSWRREGGREPPRPLGELHEARLRRESFLWKSTMSHVYGHDWQDQLAQYGGQELGPRPFQGRSLASVGTPSDPSGAPPAAWAGAGASLEEVQVPAEAPVACSLDSHRSEGGLSQESWADQSTLEIRQMLQDGDPDPDAPEEYETALVRVGTILGLRGNH